MRLVHLGLGNFLRAHQAWYTAHAPDAAEWGSPPSPAAARTWPTRCAAQDGLYTLITRGRDGDRFEVIGSAVPDARRPPTTTRGWATSPSPDVPW